LWVANNQTLRTPFQANRNFFHKITCPKVFSGVEKKSVKLLVQPTNFSLKRFSLCFFAFIFFEFSNNPFQFKMFKCKFPMPQFHDIAGLYPFLLNSTQSIFSLCISERKKWREKRRKDIARDKSYKERDRVCV